MAYSRFVCGKLQLRKNAKVSTDRRANGSYLNLIFSSMFEILLSAREGTSKDC